MYSSIAELMATDPSFGGSRVPQMQEKLYPAVAPVQKAQMDADDFLNSYLGSQSQSGDVAWGERIPVGEDPIFPMEQDEFREYVLQRLDEKYGPREVKPRGAGGPSLFPVRGI